jgi:hypothetical protein
VNKLAGQEIDLPLTENIEIEVPSAELARGSAAGQPSGFDPAKISCR